MGAGALERLLDGLSENEVRCQQPHRLARGSPYRGNAQALDQRFQNAVRSLARMDDAGRYSQRPRRGRDQQGVRFDVVGRPLSGRKLVFYQPIGGGRVRHAQQRLGQNHEGEPLLGGQGIGVQEILHPAEPAGSGADTLDKARGAFIDAPLRLRRTPRLRQQRSRDRLVGGRVGATQHGFRIHARGALRICNHGPPWAECMTLAKIIVTRGQKRQG